ncbi:hypothetical protein SAMN05192559_104126 [Halobacillus karajensis]|uniref:Uncharacterized protein n=1 Tax=Halobacillus karajensis TaxID=195088 RepID=A0A024P3A7_9BACI|nr:hypothetical protein [Halobacillus karajensis]CDQ19647.1 hypothetical protein BN982_01949 [Halobacillus karajensis]CDQ22107.1 hypothetical protein BN983_00310 [Halobacillus karajensis]CDQ27948.1 hypothetical protein BN981_02237 [Halobacillus karajensis]SEH78921.1 hypothetical protein SAMN05192559_104126 [Halobacillus karajensis]
MSNSNKTPLHLWLIALFFIFIYSYGVYDYFMMLGHDADYYNSKNYGEAVHKYFTNYPIGLLVLWTINIFGSIIASILLLFRTRWVVWIALISAISMLLLEAITFAFKNRWEVLGPFISMFDIGLLIITWAFFFYCRYLAKRGVLK